MTLSTFRVTGSIVAAVVIATAASGISAQNVPADLVITLERTSCYGECPVYSVTIDAGGNVTYAGKRFVRVEGRQQDRIPVSRVASLLATAERIGFFDLRDQYRTIRNPDGTETMVTDLPTTFVSITRSGQSKRVEDYIGAPEGLRELEQQIDEAARTTRWVRIDVPTLQQLVRDGRSPSVEERAELLRKALQRDEVAVVEALLDIGADPNAPYHDTNTPPLMMVRSAAAARALIQAGAVPSARNDNGGTPLGWAVNLPPEVTEVLLKAGVAVDQPTDSSGRTALWHAACRGNAGVVDLLIRAGADPAHRWGGMSAVECARQAREDARLRRPLVFAGPPAFIGDFDGVIALLEQAAAKRTPR